MTVELLTGHFLEFLSLKGDYTGSSKCHIAGNHMSGLNYDFNGIFVSDLRFKFGPEITVERHLRSTRKNSDIDFFNMYIRNEDDFSKHTTGLLGKAPFVFARHTLEMV